MGDGMHHEIWLFVAEGVTWYFPEDKLYKQRQMAGEIYARAASEALRRHHPHRV